MKPKPVDTFMKPIPVGLLLLVAWGIPWPLAMQAQDLEVGTVSFPNSGAAEAQQAFLRGVAALHSFWKDEAAEAFQEAQRIDPDFALAYWGEAMTHNFPFGTQPNAEAAHEVLTRLAPNPEARLAKAPTPREKGLLRALERLYGEGDKDQRDMAYSEAMRRLYEAYPKDLEVACFYALSILGTTRPGEGSYRKQMRAAALLETLFDQAPNHPGVLHYLIHAYDDPTHAVLGMRPAKIYAGVAPAAPHALHMPSHIFVQLGQWDGVAASNEDAYAASIAWVEQRGHSVSMRDYHSFYWLLYAYLQQGRRTQAAEVLSAMEAIAQQSDAPTVRVHYAFMKARYVIEAADWARAPLSADAAPFPSDLIKSSILLAAGMGAVHTGQFEKAEEARDILHGLKIQNEEANPYAATLLHIMENEVAALILAAQGNREEALALLATASAMEQGLDPPRGLPLPSKPSLELYGEFLLEAQQPAAAIAPFKQSLLRTPNRPASLLGLARALARSGQAEAAKESYSRLIEIWHQADSSTPGLDEARQFIEAHP